MTTVQLKYLLILKESNSFIEAASSAHVSFQALYKSIKSLENELDIRLVESTARGTRLTDAGVKLCSVAENLFDQLDDLMSLFKDQHKPEIFNILIGSCKYYSLQPLISKVLHIYKKIRFFEVNENEIFNFLDDNQNKIALINRIRIGKQYSLSLEDGFRFYPIRTIKLNVWAKKGHKITAKNLVELNGIPFVVAQNQTKDLLKRILPTSEIVIETMPEIAANLMFEEGYLTFSGKSDAGTAFFKKDDIEKMICLDIATEIDYTEGFVYKENAVFTPSERNVLISVIQWLKMM